MAKSSLVSRPDLSCKCVPGSEDLVFLDRQISLVISLVLLSTADFDMRERVTYCMTLQAAMSKQQQPSKTWLKPRWTHDQTDD